MKRCFLLVLVLATPLFLSQALFGQDQEVAVKFSQQMWGSELVLVGAIPGSDWKSVDVKNKDSELTPLRLQSSKDGLGRLSWRLPNLSGGRLEINKAKSQTALHGKLTIENSGFLVVMTGSSSVSLRDLKTHLALSPGYYAVTATSQMGITSNWVTFQIK